jgi:hypothetical protein
MRPRSSSDRRFACGSAFRSCSCRTKRLPPRWWRQHSPRWTCTRPRPPRRSTRRHRCTRESAFSPRRKSRSWLPLLRCPRASTRPRRCRTRCPTGSFRGKRAAAYRIGRTRRGPPVRRGCTRPDHCTPRHSPRRCCCRSAGPDCRNSRTSRNALHPPNTSNPLERRTVPSCP